MPLLALRSLWEKLFPPPVVEEPAICSVLREDYARNGGHYSRAPKDVLREDTWITAVGGDSWTMRIRQFFLGRY
jgi:hypothetical protein